MTFSTTKGFWKLFEKLPQEIRKRVPQKLELWKEHPRYPSLHFKKVSASTAPQVWSLRISDDYRMLGYREAVHVTWFWIGTHADYDKKLSHLK